ncbi:hepatic and glial cell adhesion molecule-like isoform X2 [Narcine bancroftii]|uniref:hepatic and glial cell adhesion molecule-like isoform X2 n=1 Tax=Narcine bancroftii TaxID=1343680 RepID=UPI003831F835
MFTVVLVLHFLTIRGTEISAQSDTVIDASVGQDVHFRVDIPCTDCNEVTFEILSSIDAILASWAMDKLMQQHPLYEGRLHWRRNGSVVLSNVQVNDSHRYRISIYSISTDAKETYFYLHVFEPVSKPVITKTGNCLSPNITLICSVSTGTNVTFCWEIHSLTRDINRTCHGPELVINHVNEVEQYTCRCIATNRISNASSEKKELCHKSDGFLVVKILPCAILISIVIICYEIIQITRAKQYNLRGNGQSSSLSSKRRINGNGNGKNGKHGKNGKKVELTQTS